MVEPAGLLSEPRLCILGGTALTRPGGYAEVLRQAPDFGAIDVYHLGFGGSASFAYWSDHVDFSQFGVCLLDFSADDAAAVAQGRLGPDDAATALNYAVARLTEAECMPVILLPVLPPANWALREAVLRIARQCRIPVFDAALAGSSAETPAAIGPALARSITAAWGFWQNSAERIPLVRQGHRLSFKALGDGGAGPAEIAVGPEEEVVAILSDGAPDGSPAITCVPCAPVRGLDGSVLLGSPEGPSGEALSEMRGVIIRRPAELTCISRLPFPWRLEAEGESASPHERLRFGSKGGGTQVAIGDAAGWSVAETSLRWAVGQESELEIIVPEGQEIASLTFLAAPFLRAPRVPSQSLAVVAGDHSLALFTLDEPRITRLSVDVPGGLFAPGMPARFTLLHPDAVRPVDLGESGTRELSLAFMRLDVTYREPAQQAEIDPPSDVAEPVPVQTVEHEALVEAVHPEPVAPMEEAPPADIGHSEPEHAVEDERSLESLHWEPAHGFEEEATGPVEAPVFGNVAEAPPEMPTPSYDAPAIVADALANPVVPPPVQPAKAVPGEKRAGLGRFFSRLFGG